MNGNGLPNEKRDPKRLSQAAEDQIWQVYQATGGLSETARQTGHARNTVGCIVRERQASLPVIAPTPVVATIADAEPQQVQWDEKTDTATVDFTSDRQIKTEAEALAHAEVDTAVWYVKRWSCSGWTTPVKLRQGQNKNGQWQPDKGFFKQNWKVHLELARLLPRPFQDAHEAIFERMKAHAPVYTPIRHMAPKTPHLLEIDLFDVHIGKLAWAPETGENYDLRLAEMIFRDAVEDLIGYASGFEIDQIVLPVGNDFFHVDGPTNTTTAGTPQDVDGRFAKVIEVGEMAMVWAIEFLMQVAPVKVIWVPGNHDRVASFHLMRTLAAWFRNTVGVEVDRSPKVRKYVHYGVNLLGYVHGDKEKPSSLPMIMATEEPAAWAASLYREFRIGHRHTSKRLQTTPVEDHDGMGVRTLQSLCGKDAYHYTAGYAGGRRAAEAFLMARDRVMTVNYQVSLRDRP